MLGFGSRIMTTTRHQKRRVCTVLGLLLFLATAASGNVFARDVQEIETSGGIKAWLVEEHSIRLISIRFSFLGGATQDPAGKEGLSRLLGSLLTEGAGDLDAEVFARRLADQGAQLSMSSARDQIFGGLDTITKRFEASAELLRLALVSPRFDASAVERVKQQQISDLEQSENEPRAVAFNNWYARSFPGQAYGRPVNGTPASVKAITRDDIETQYGRLFAKNLLKVVIVGDIDREGATRALDTIFGGLPLLSAVDVVPQAKLQHSATPVVLEKDIPLATAAFGAYALPINDPGFPALQILNHIIGSGDFDATLMDEIRVKRGLAYSVSISLLSDTAQSIMLGGMATKNENMGEALGVLKDVLTRTAANGPTLEQFENAKLYLTGSYLLDFDTNGKLANSLLRIWREGRSPKYMDERNVGIERTTLDDVKRIARSSLAWERFNITIIGKGLVPK